MTRARSFARWIGVATVTLTAMTAVAAIAATGAEPQRPASIEITIGSNRIQAALATTLAEREKGLMGRDALPDTAGMLFVFAGDGIRNFWMLNTPTPLSIAFLDSAKTILNVEEMAANDAVTIHRSSRPARYALEMRAGWFRDRNVGPGAKAAFTLPTGIRIDP